MNSRKLQLRLLDKRAKTLDVVVDTCKNYEAAQRNFKTMEEKQEAAADEDIKYKIKNVFH